VKMLAWPVHQFVLLMMISIARHVPTAAANVQMPAACLYYMELLKNTNKKICY
jgi:hypothetical protein